LVRDFHCILLGYVVKSCDMSEIEHEVASQPVVWEQAAGLDGAEVLPPPGARLAVVGCGTSLYMGQAYAASRESLGLGESDAFPASEFPVGRGYDMMLAISRSGTTTEVLHLLAGAAGRIPTVVLTAVAQSPVARAADRSLALPFADERSVVQTRFATSVLVLLRTHLGIDPAPAVAAARRVLDAPLPIDPEAFERFHFLGSGWTVGLAFEAALKLREAARAWTEAYPAMEYRHGPIAVADERTLIVAMGGIEPSLAEEIRATGATLLEDDDPLASLVGAQRLAISLAGLRGLDPDAPRNLTRSVVL